MEFIAKELGSSKALNVKTSNKNMLKTVDYQLEMLKLEEKQKRDDLTVIETLQISREIIRKPVDYLMDLLTLTKKQKETLEELDQAEVTSLANRLLLRVQGLSEVDIEDYISDRERDTEKK